MTEQEIITGCKRGKEKAFKALVDRYAPMLMGVCMRYLRETTRAQDVLQESLIIVFQNIQQYTGQGAFGGWLRRIAVTTCLKTLRKQTLQTEELDLTNDTHDSAESEQDLQYDTDEIIEIVNSLPEIYLIVFNLHVVEGYPHTEIADMLGINTSTSRARLTRARTMVRELLTKKNMTYEVAEARRVYSK